MFGFVAYQLWGTGIETARAQNALENEFEELLAGTTTTDAPVVVVDSCPTRCPTRCPTHGGRHRGRRDDRTTAGRSADRGGRRDRPHRDAHHRRRQHRRGRCRQERPEEGSGSLPGDSDAGPVGQLGDRRPPHHVRPAVLRRRQVGRRRRDRASPPPRVDSCIGSPASRSSAPTTTRSSPPRTRPRRRSPSRHVIRSGQLANAS